MFPLACSQLSTVTEHSTLTECMLQLLVNICLLTRGNRFSVTSFQLRMEVIKGQKQSKDEKMQEDFLTSIKMHSI